MITRFMQVMFSAAENGDEELTSQVANDIETAKSQEKGDGVEDDEVSYVNLGSGKVLITDKENGEATIAEQNEDDPEQYDLEGFENDEDLLKYLHTVDGIELNEDIEDPNVEDINDHMEHGVISPNLENGGLNPDAGREKTVDELHCPECCDKDDEDEDDEDEEKTYSVSMTGDELALFSEYCQDVLNNANSAVVTLYSNPDFYCRLFSDILEEDKPSIIGDLKFEKEDDDTIIVTDLETGDEAQVTVDDDDEFVVSEVQKELAEDEKTYSFIDGYLAGYYESLFSDSDEEGDEDEDEDNDEEDNEDEDEDDDDEEDDDEDDENEEDNEDEEDDENDDEDEDEEEKNYSAYIDGYLNGYYESLFSDSDEDNDEEDNEDEDEDEDDECGDEYEPLFVVGVDPVNHLIVDSPVYGSDLAQQLVDRLEVEGVENLEIFDDPDEAREHAMNLLSEEGVTDPEEQVDQPQEHQFSDVTIYTTRYFSDCTEYMFKLFSEAEDDVTDSQDDIEKAIESGKQTETKDEIITPLDDTTAIVQDKETDEYTKVTLDGDELNTQKLSEEEADKLIQNKEEERKYSLLNRFFADIEQTQDEAEAAQQGNPGEVDPSRINPETGDPMMEEGKVPERQGVELVEDKALEAVQSIQDAANQAVLAITDAKNAPAPGEDQDLKEAQFTDTLDQWVYML